MAATTTNQTVVMPVLRDDNPYYNGSVFIFPDGSMSLDRTPGIYIPSADDRYYTVADGEEIDIVAYEAYASSKYWWIIADTNGIFFPLDIPIGTTFTIPDMDTYQVNNM